MKQLGLNTNILDQAKRVFRQDVQLSVIKKKKATTPIVSRPQKDAIGRRTSPRQKTLGPRTECSACHNSHGKLCGKCLYIRYGENLLEAKEKESWKCPACRGICNCSRCREKKGWPPTGSIHDHAWKLGYKSVAHYLIHTRRAE
ncbi:Cell division cycle-associated protein 7 [Sesamum angolense]|uniref:Cell division cycle-associated protein 7 n=1 Tax=Sesamum angolense TaxID=2727404 RepID=A0AAE1T7M8_9LAMI|nr:Cell division cycle-associated protein 7 [Sesamum angolense]